MANNQLNWSYFKPEFSGKPEEETEAHLLRSMDWMTTHDFPEDEKVRRSQVMVCYPKCSTTTIKLGRFTR